MVSWYKHDIPAWMDGTEALSDGAYRAYHVICQMIYLNEGAIACNEHGIAGRCRQSLRAFRKNLAELLQSGKLTLENGRLRNSRADVELEKVDDNRMNASKGGEISGKSRKSTDKPLKTHDPPQATLQEDRSLLDKTRRDETRKGRDAQARPPNGEALKSKRGGRLTDAWRPSEQNRSQAKQLGLSDRDIEKIWPTFLDYWLGCPGQKGVKADWDATWRVWCRREAEKLGRTAIAEKKTESFDWEAIMVTYRDKRIWPFQWPEPGYSGCRVPADVLDRFGYGASSQERQAMRFSGPDDSLPGLLEITRQKAS